MLSAADRKYRGLGYDISAAKSIKEAQKIAQLDWQVFEMPVTAEFDTGSVKVPGWKIIYRKDKDHPTGIRVFDIPTNGYTPIQNFEILSLYTEIAKLGDMKLETAGPINKGERIFAIARIAGEFHFPGVSDKSRIDHGEGNVAKDDATYLKILMGAGHRSGIADTLDIIAERQICTNGAIITEGVGRWKFIHKKKLTDKDREEVVQFVGKAKELFETYKHKAQLLRDTKFPDEVNRIFAVELLQKELLKDVVKAVKDRRKAAKLTEASPEFGRMLIDSILKGKNLEESKLSLPVRTILASIPTQPGADMALGTGWNTYNAVTYYIDHTKGRTSDTGLEGAFYGEGAKIKMRALELAVNYAERLAL